MPKNIYREKMEKEAIAAAESLKVELNLVKICLEQERLKNSALTERLRLVEIAARGE